MRAFLSRINGAQTLENGPFFWASFIVVCVAFAAFPLYGSALGVSNFALFFLYVPMALGLALLWGFTGILSFGQTAFFGIGGYVYGIISINLLPPAGFGAQGYESIAAVAGALVAAAVVAAIFGYFVFYGEVSAWIVPLLTLVLSLVLQTFMSQTAGYQWRVGNALLGGYNGMTSIPSMQIGLLSLSGGSVSFLYLVLVVSVLIYLALRILVNSSYGQALVAIREDVDRTRMLGHNVPRKQVGVFVMAAALAAMSGALYTAWGNYIDPSTMNLSSAALPVVWVAVGGRRSLTAVLLSAVLLGYFSDLLAVRGGQYAFVVQGALLLVIMMFCPEGIFYSLARKFSKSSRARRVIPLPRPTSGSR